MSQAEKPDIGYLAIHETAHAVVGMLLGAPVEAVTIISDMDAGSDGHAITVHGCPLSHLGSENWALMTRAIGSYAGHMATLKLGHDESFEDAGAADDYYNAAGCLTSIFGSGDVSPLFDRVILATKLIVDMCWGSIELVADELQEKKTLTGEEVESLLKECYGNEPPSWAA